jgi:transcriptional regulator with XRE-family HTH domain
MGERLKLARKRAALGQADLATAAGVGIATIRRIEQGHVEPRMATTRRIAEVLSVRAEWLVFGTDPMAEDDEGERG